LVSHFLFDVTIVMKRQAKALLLTGVPGSGKTTVVEKVVAALPDMQVRGFMTTEIRRAGRRVGFELSTFAGDKRLLAHVDIDSPYRVGRYGVDVQALDDIAEEALTLYDSAEVYVVDEVGKMECFSAKFCAAMRRLLDSDVPVVATVARRGAGLIAEVKRRSDVELWEITRANRDQMPSRIVRWLHRAMPIIDAV
jgi:nucleoside-triphosphatase